MKTGSEEIRDEQWERIRRGLNDSMRQVHTAFLTHGPCTTMELSTLASLNPFVVRPRTSDLLDLGLVELTGRKGREGIYRGIPLEEARAKCEVAARKIPVQRTLF